jgi:hypothetical protein
MVKYSRPLRVFLEEFEQAVNAHEVRCADLIRLTALDAEILEELVATGNAMDQAYDRFLSTCQDLGYAIGTVHPSGVLTEG